jgi:PAS domain S-box-containing protein
MASFPERFVTTSDPDRSDAQSLRALDDARFRALVTATSDVVYRMSPDWSEMYRLDGRDFIQDTHEPSRTWMDTYIHPEDRSRVQDAIERAIRSRSRFELEHRVLRPDGTLAWTFSRAIPLLDDAQEIIEWVGTATDVTAQKAAEQRASAQRRLYEAILTNTPDLAYVFDLQHRFIYANEGLLRMWGKSWDEAIGKSCLELGYEPWHAAMHDREIEQVVATKQPVRGVVPFDGTFGRRMYDYLFVPVFNSAGEVEAVAGTTRDVTEQKQFADELKLAQEKLAVALSAAHMEDRRKDEFLAMLAHELRNPLAPIRNAAELLKLVEVSDPRGRNARDIIERQVRHMVHLVDDLMDVSRITLGRITLRDDDVSLRSVLTDAIETGGPAIEALNHTLHVQMPAETMTLRGDATRLSQIFQNLLNNAAKYTPPGGHIHVCAERQGGDVRVSVKDTGIGIPADSHDRIFELFTRLHTEEFTSSRGLGIGLALAKQLVELHGGRLQVASDGAGKGSEFSVFLPLEQRPHAYVPAPADDGVAKVVEQRRVLVVDDNQDAAESLTMLLQSMGCVAQTTLNGHDALATAPRFKPDVILLDIGMPDLNGYEVARQLREMPELRHVMLVALTGWGQPEDKRRAAEAGFDQHLTKPVDPAVLFMLIGAGSVLADSESI